MVTPAGRQAARDIAAGRSVNPDVRTTIADLTDSSGGTANDTVAAVAGSGADAVINDNFADLTAKVNGILVHLRDRGAID